MLLAPVLHHCCGPHILSSELHSTFRRVWNANVWRRSEYRNYALS